MIELENLLKIVDQVLEYITSHTDIQDAEIFVSWYYNITVRLNYTSDIACNGVQEPKNILGYGVGVFVSLKTPDGLKTGYGSDTADLTLSGVKSALRKARVNAVLDPDYKSLPNPVTHGNDIDVTEMNFEKEVTDEQIISLGWKTIESAIKEFQKKNISKSLIVGGDINIILEKMDGGNTNGRLESYFSSLISS